jgi:carbon storage regulator
MEKTMLNLSRKADQYITIGEDIKITVLKIGNGDVILGIDAPQILQILRDDAKQKTPKKRVT